MEIARDEYEVDYLKKWANENKGEDSPFYDGGDYYEGYANGVADTLAWLLGETRRVPGE